MRCALGRCCSALLQQRAARCQQPALLWQHGPGLTLQEMRCVVRSAHPLHEWANRLLPAQRPASPAAAIRVAPAGAIICDSVCCCRQCGKSIYGRCCAEACTGRDGRRRGLHLVQHMQVLRMRRPDLMLVIGCKGAQRLHAVRERLHAIRDEDEELAGHVLALYDCASVVLAAVGRDDIEIPPRNVRPAQRSHARIKRQSRATEQDHVGQSRSN